MSEKLTPDAFASRIKEKYPEYADVDNTVLTNRIVEKYPEYKDKVDLGPGLGKVGGGLLAEIAIGEGSKAAGATAGAALGSVVPGIGTAIGATLGYVAGGIAGGVAGSLTAQEIEGRDEKSWGRVAADTFLNLIPGGLGKAKKGVGVLPRLAQEGAKRAAGGAVISATGAQIEKAVEDRELLTQDELLTAAAVGGTLGLGLGAAGELMKKAYPKFGGKGSQILNDAYEKGDPDAMQVVETVAGENPVGRGSRFKRMIFERVAPSKLVGKDATLNAVRAKNEAEAAVDLASQVRKTVNEVTANATDKEKALLDDYVTGKSEELPERFQPIQGTLDDARNKIEQYQNQVMELYHNGDIELDDRVAQKIQDSIDSRDYFTREYRFYEDSSYVPSADSKNKLKSKLIKDGMSSEEADTFIVGLEKQRNEPVALMNSIYGEKRVLKARKELSDEMREFLGEYEDVGEKMFGTISRLGRLASYESGNRRIVDSLLKNNIAKGIPLSEPAGDLRELTVRGKGFQDADGNKVYVPADVNKALDDLYSTGAVKDSGPWMARMIGDTLATTTAAAKFVRVPLNLASYPVQLFGNMVLVAGQGFNPFRGYKRGAGVAVNEALPDRFKTGKIPLLEVNRLKELGIVNKGVTASDIRDGFKNGITPKFFQQAVKGVGNAYNIFDTAQRISVFENYKKFLRDSIPDADIKRMGQREFEQLAADLTNDTYMNYDRISKGLRGLSRYGVLNEFGAFNLELARTTWNQGRLAKSMVDGSFVNKLKEDYGINLDPATVSKIQREGYKRFAALSAVLVAGSTVPMVMNREGGITEDKEKAMRETALAPWEQDQALHIRLDGTKARAANIGYQVPTAELASIFEAGWRDRDSFLGATGGMIDSFWSKFGGDLTINMKNIVAAVNNLDPTNGKPISKRPEESLGRKFDLVGWYLGKTFTPGTVSDLQKLDERETTDNILRYTLGYRVRNFDIVDGANYKFRDINKNLRALGSSYASDTFQKDSLEGSYQRHNQIYQQNMSDAIRHTNNLRTLEVPEEKIEESLKKSFSKDQTAKIMRGEVDSMPISSGVRISDRAEKRKRYAELAGKMPESLALRMLQEDFDDKKIKRSDVQAVIRLMQMENYPQ